MIEILAKANKERLREITAEALDIEEALNILIVKALEKYLDEVEH